MAKTATELAGSELSIIATLLLLLLVLLIGSDLVHLTTSRAFRGRFPCSFASIKATDCSKLSFGD